MGCWHGQPSGVLLNNVATGYRLFKGSVDLSALAPGLYTIELAPQEQKLLLAGVELDDDGNGGVVTSDNVLFSVDPLDVAGDDLVIEILVPEPTSLLLIAGAGLLLRRRR